MRALALVLWVGAGVLSFHSHAVTLDYNCISGGGFLKPEVLAKVSLNTETLRLDIKYSMTGRVDISIEGYPTKTVEGEVTSYSMYMYGGTVFLQVPGWLPSTTAMLGSSIYGGWYEFQCL